MAENDRCPSCGQDMPANTPQGLCPACSLRQGTESEATSRSDRAEPDATAAPSDQPPVEASPILEQCLGGDLAKASPPPAAYGLGAFALRYRPWLFTVAAFAALLVLATAISLWQALRATRAERLALAERHRALDAEWVANEQTDRAQQAEQAEQTVRAELERAQTQVRRIIEATVYLKNKVAGKVISTGTGFVIDVQGDTVVVATNRQVALPDVADIPSRLVPPGSKLEIEAVFWSGQGLHQEQALQARIFATDTSVDLTSEPAFLVVKGVKRRPTPIGLDIRSDPTEGIAYIGAGFPLGGMLNKVQESKGNPSVTVTRGIIATLWQDEHGQLQALQMDGSLQQGMSGGPIIDERTGALIGIGVSEAARGKTTEFVIPAEEVRRALAGRVGALDLTLQSIQQGTADIQVKAQIVDPNGAVDEVTVHVAPASAGTIVPYDGSWPPLPNSERARLQHDPSTASASGRVQLALSGEGAPARRILIQTALRDRSGQLVYSKPKKYDLPEQSGRIQPSDTPLERILKSARRNSFALLEPLIDPDKDCQLVKDEESYKVKIVIPGKLHSLSPEISTRLDKKQSLHNAPFTVTEVEGDFAAVVEVTGDIEPGAALPKDRKGNKIPFTSQSGGLILYQDKNNFLHVERAGSVLIGERLHPVHRLVIEAVKDGVQSMHPIYTDVPEKDILLVIIRRKGQVRCLYSTDGGRQIQALHEFALDLPKKVKIGLTASNISAKPLTMTFENFALLDDVTIIDTKFEDRPK